MKAFVSSANSMNFNFEEIIARWPGHLSIVEIIFVQVPNLGAPHK